VTLRRGARSSICLPCQRRLARLEDEYQPFGPDYDYER
jgi:hypothetical protein